MHFARHSVFWNPGLFRIEKIMTQQKKTHGGGHIGGVSLSSFLQMLEQERKSCTLVVSSGEQQGSFYFNDGILIDAKYESEVGEDAAYRILLWENPVFSVTSPEDRMRRIYLPLAHILLDSAKLQDETDTETDAARNTHESYDHDGDLVEPDHSDPAVRKVIRSIASIPDIKHYFLLNRQGKLISQSSKRMKIADFIAYCIVSGVQIRKSLNIKGPSSIQLVLANGETLMIMPGSGMIIGLLLNEFASVSEVSDKLTGISAGS